MDDFRKYMTETINRHLIPGVGVIALRGEEVLLHEGFGLADREKGTGVTPETIFGIGSITKSFTALAIMQLQDAGRLNVQDRVTKYLPAFTSTGRSDLTGITLHHLLSNSSGLPPLPYLRNALAKSVLADPSFELMGLKEDQYANPVATADEIVELITNSDVELLAEPGAIFSYCNDGWALLGRIIELVSGNDYVEHVKANILEPLGMTRSTFDAGELAQMDDVTNLYSYIGGFDRVEPTPGWWEAPAMTAAGFLKSTTGDMARYARVFLGETDLISAESLKLMVTPHIRTSAQRHYGYGLMIQEDYHGRKMVEHGGNIKGVAAYMTTFPDEKLIGVALANITGGPVGQMALSALNVPLGLPLHTEREEYTETGLDAEALARLTGRYESEENTVVDLFLNDAGELQADLKSTVVTARPVSRDAVLVDLNGADALIQYLDEGENGFGQIFFGFRVLRRTGEGQVPGKDAEETLII